MLTVNKVMLAGNLTRDPVVRQTQAGAPVGDFGLAMNERYTTQSGEEREDACFVDVQVWGKLAQNCAEYLSKGSAAFVEGRLRCNRWEDRETGQPRTRLVIRADRVQFISTPNREARGSTNRPRSGANRPRGGGTRRNGRQDMPAFPQAAGQ